MYEPVPRSTRNGDITRWRYRGSTNFLIVYFRQFDILGNAASVVLGHEIIFRSSDLSVYINIGKVEFVVPGILQGL